MDIRGFTGFAEGVSPQVVVEILNRHLERMTEAIFAHAGTVTKFTGDGLMAMFNAPLPQADHALRAVRAALALLEGARQEGERFLDMPREDAVAALYEVGLEKMLALAREDLSMMGIAYDSWFSERSLNESGLFDEVREARQFGIEVGEAKLDLGRAHAYKSGVVDKNAKGIEYLFKKNEIEGIHGRGWLLGTARESRRRSVDRRSSRNPRWARSSSWRTRRPLWRSRNSFRCSAGKRSDPSW